MKYFFDQKHLVTAVCSFYLTAAVHHFICWKSLHVLHSNMRELKYKTYKNLIVLWLH